MVLEKTELKWTMVKEKRWRKPWCFWVLVQFNSVAQSCLTLCDPMNHSTPGLPVHHQLPEFTQTHVHPVSDGHPAISSCHPLLPLPPIPPNIRVFSNESTLLIRWPKYWTFRFSIIPSKEIPGLISFRMDWLDLLAVMVWNSDFESYNMEENTRREQKGWWGVLRVQLRLEIKRYVFTQSSSVTQSSDSLQPHRLQNAMLPCPSPAPEAYSNSCPSTWWCHPKISSSVVPFSSHLQSFPASGCFPMSQLFASGGQSIRVSPSASVLPMNIQDWFPLGLTGLISLQSKGLSRVFSNTTVQKHQFFDAQLVLHPTQHFSWCNCI